MTRLALTGLCLLTMVASSGCVPFWLFFEDEDDAPPAVRPPPAPLPPSNADTTPPRVTPFNPPLWPPYGPDDVLQLSASDDVALARLELDFAQHLVMALSGTEDSVFVSAADLGEGYGPLDVTAFDQAGASATLRIDGLLVDLSPPEITLGEVVLQPAGELEVWLADTWVLDRVRFYVDAAQDLGVHDLPDAYPDTLGLEWHYEKVTFSLGELAPGTYDAGVWVADGAGNETSESFTLVVDGTAPTLQLLSPADGAVVAGPFQASVEASDPEGGPVWIEVSLDATVAASGPGPSAVFDLDAGALAPGPHTLAAVARDEAGNASEAASVTIQVP